LSFTIEAQGNTPRDSREIAIGCVHGKSRSPENRAHSLGLTLPDLQERHRTGCEQRRQTGNNLAVGVEAISPAIERVHRFKSDIGGQILQLACRDIWRIRENNIKSAGNSV
jgi:hypothetical protein